MYKVGDKVLVKKGGRSTSSQALAGRVCTIEKVNSDFVILIEETIHEYILSKGGVWFNEIEPFKQSPKNVLPLP